MPRIDGGPFTTESGTYDFFTETVLETDAEQRTQDVQTSAEDNQIVTGIAGTAGALGYVGFAFADLRLASPSAPTLRGT